MDERGDALIDRIDQRLLRHVDGRDNLTVRSLMCAKSATAKQQMADVGGRSERRAGMTRIRMTRRPDRFGGKNEPRDQDPTLRA